MLKAFLPKTIRLFAVHHWTGFDQSCDQLGGLESCHYLASRTVKRFCDIFPKPERKPRVREADLAILDADAGDAAIPIADAAAAERGDEEEQAVNRGLEPSITRSYLETGTMG